MSTSQIKLEGLFRRCDKKGTGFIDIQDFRYVTHLRNLRKIRAMAVSDITKSNTNTNQGNNFQKRYENCKCFSRDLCLSFDIDSGDADIIFTDLDHDGDGQIRFKATNTTELLS